MKNFLDSVVAAAERYRELPDKFIDTNMVLLGQIIISVTIEVSVIYLENLVVNSCSLSIL